MEIAVGYDFSCALLTTGHVECWGYGGDGSLGNNSYNNSPIPVSVSGLTSAAQISAGEDSMCALSGGAVKCWGGGYDGQLGDGNTGSSDVPVSVSGLVGAASVSLNNAYSACAIKAGGTMVCWGDNTYGEIGNGTQGLQLNPAVVSNVTPL
jgi:alpha-tubulin suppressor-like RCC1 family protein